MKAIVLVALVPLLACSHERETPQQQAQPSAEMTGELPKRMRNCPSAVPSARTTSRPTVDGVDITITSDDPEARRQIVALAGLHGTLRDPIRVMPEHTGMHSGPGTVGRCPIIHAGTSVSYDEVPNGVRIHVVAESQAQIKPLQKATAARVRALEMPSS